VVAVAAAVADETDTKASKVGRAWNYALYLDQ